MGYVYLYTGNGAGKTTNALGLALRSVGHKHKVVIIQFLKWWKNIGEYKVRKMLEPYYEIYQFGRPGWIGVKKRVALIGGEKVKLENLKDEDRELARKALKFAEKVLREKKPHLLVLDEINLALHWRLLDVKEVLNILKDLPKRTDVVLTGRYAPKELIDRADFVNEIVDVKHPEKMTATKGIQF
ncbi:cob(I)yrinic acid a,c-diamide adenosyltransferase [Candidatus Bathyarchaeota archaeon]|nr:cob(I)yrinic acid a,c-diamide adenosyltransferase [Candidatus Bathyarchaeota archaeon]